MEPLRRSNARKAYGCVIRKHHDLSIAKRNRQSVRQKRLWVIKTPAVRGSKGLGQSTRAAEGARPGQKMSASPSLALTMRAISHLGRRPTTRLGLSWVLMVTNKREWRFLLERTEQCARNPRWICVPARRRIMPVPSPALKAFGPPIAIALGSLFWATLAWAIWSLS